MCVLLLTRRLLWIEYSPPLPSVSKCMLTECSWLDGRTERKQWPVERAEHKQCPVGITEHKQCPVGRTEHKWCPVNPWFSLSELKTVKRFQESLIKIKKIFFKQVCYFLCSSVILAFSIGIVLFHTSYFSVQLRNFKQELLQCFYCPSQWLFLFCQILSLRSCLQFSLICIFMQQMWN